MKSCLNDKGTLVLKIVSADVTENLNECCPAIKLFKEYSLSSNGDSVVLFLQDDFTLSMYIIDNDGDDNMLEVASNVTDVASCQQGTFILSQGHSLYLQKGLAPRSPGKSIKIAENIAKIGTDTVSYIYYITLDGQLFLYNLDDDMEIYIDDNVLNASLTNVNGYHIVGYQKDDVLCWYNLKSGEMEIYDQEEIGKFVCFGNYLYLFPKDDSYVIRYSFSGQRQKSKLAFNPDNIKRLEVDDYIKLYTNNNSLYTFDGNTLEKVHDCTLGYFDFGEVQFNLKPIEF